MVSGPLNAGPSPEEITTVPGNTDVVSPDSDPATRDPTQMPMPTVESLRTSSDSKHEHANMVQHMCRDAKGRHITFIVPANLRLSTSRRRQQPQLGIGLLSLPVEVLQLIALALHPVDRICLALTSKKLLTALFSGPLKPSGTSAWSHSDITDSETVHELNRILGWERRRAHYGFDFVYSHSSVNLKYVDAMLQPCRLCANDALYRPISNPDLRLRLLTGWSGMNSWFWGLCNSCDKIQTLNPEPWNKSWTPDRPASKWRWDQRIHSSCSVSKRSWSMMTESTRRKWAIQQWTSGSPVFIDRNVNGPYFDPNGAGKRLASRKDWRGISVNVGGMFLCPGCISEELGRSIPPDSFWDPEDMTYVRSPVDESPRGVRRRRRSWMQRLLVEPVQDVANVTVLLGVGVTKMINGAADRKL